MTNVKCTILSLQERELAEMKLTYSICCERQSLECQRPAPHHQFKRGLCEAVASSGPHGQGGQLRAQ
jgi:hypothetical protein